MRRLWLIILLLAPLAVSAQQVVVSGSVTDEKTGDCLRQVSVSAGRVSVVTNEDGVFTLKLDQMPTAITVSHLGYKTRKVNLQEGKTENLKVRLVPTAIQLREIVVRTSNPRELVEIAIRKIPENYSRKPELLQTFYRETAMKRKHYIYVAEGVEDMYKTPYTRNIGRDRVAIVKGRRLLSQKQGDTLGIKVMGGPVLPVQLDVVKNQEMLLNKENLDAYNFSFGDPEYINDRMQYVVKIGPRYSMEYALYHGKLYIDGDDIYVPTEQGLYVIRDKKSRLLTKKDDFFTLTRMGDKLYALAGDGIYHVSDGKVQQATAFSFEAPDYGLFARQSQDGKLFIADAHNLYQYDGKAVCKLASGFNLIKSLLN